MALPTLLERLERGRIWFGDLDRAATEIKKLRSERDKLRDVLIWSEENCPGKCAGPIRVALCVSSKAAGPKETT